MCRYLASILLRVFYKLFYGFVIQMIKNYVAKVLLALSGTFLHGSSCKYNSFKFIYKFAIIFFFCPCVENNNKKEIFRTWWSGNEKYF